MASEDEAFRDWSRDTVFLDVLQQHILPEAAAAHPACISSVQAVCRSWARASETSPYQHIKAKLWGTDDIASLTAFLRRHSRIASLDVSSADPDISTLRSSHEASSKGLISALLQSLPSSLTSVAFEGVAALPLALLLCCLRLPRLTHLSFRSLPDKWSFTPGMFPWDEVLVHEIVAKVPHLEAGHGAPLQELQRTLRAGGAAGLQAGPDLNQAMYGAAVWRRFQESWMQYELGVAACLLVHGCKLEGLALESPARSLCNGIVRSLTSCGSSNLCSLHLIGFGGKSSSNAEFGEHVIGLDLTSLPQARSLTCLKLVACGVAPTPASTLESLARLEVLHLSRTSIVFTDRPPYLAGLPLLGELVLDHAEWLTPDGEVWGAEGGAGSEDDPAQQLDLLQLSPAQPEGHAPLQFHLCPSASLAVLSMWEFEGQVSLPLSAMSALTSLSVTMDTPELHPLHSLQQWVAPGTASVPGAATAAAAALGSGTSGTEAQPRDAPLCSLQHLSTNAAGLNMVQSMGLLSSCTGLRQLELAGVLPQQLRLPELCMLEHITSLTFKGGAEEGMEAESAQGPQSTSSDADDDLISFAPGPGCLPNLLELCLDVGCMGITELDLRHLAGLTKLVVDNIEFIDLSKTFLPPSLSSLTLYAWYGLPELFALQEGEHDVPLESLPHRLQSLEQVAEHLFCNLLSQLPFLEMCEISWDLFRFMNDMQSKICRTYVLPRLRELKCQWKRQLSGEELSLLSRVCPIWECVSISSGTRKQRYLRMSGNTPYAASGWVLHKTCGCKCEEMELLV